MPTDSSNDTQNGALGVVPKEPEMVAVHAASTTPHVESIQEIKKETQEEVQHAKSRIKVKRFIPTFLIGVVLGLLSVFGATLYLYIQESQVKISDVRVTNVADGSFTVTWVTDKEAKSAVYYSKDDNWVPLFNFLNKSKEYDDRDVTSDDKGKETIENKGDYYTHHVTLEGLTPNERYYFRIGTGVVKAFDKDVDGNKIEPIMTGPTLDALSTPYPIYGRVFKQDRTALEDSLIYVQLKDETAQTSTWLSTYTAAQGTWTVDLSNARHLHLEEGFRIDDDVARIVEVHGAVAGETSLFLTDENDQPAPDVYLGQPSEAINYTPVAGLFDKLVLSAEAQTVTWSCNGLTESNKNTQDGFAAVWCHPEARWKWEAAGNTSACGGNPSLPVNDPSCNPGSAPPPTTGSCGGWDCNGFCLTDQITMSNFDATWCDGQARWKWERAGGNNSCGGSASVLENDPSCKPVDGGGTVVKDSANDPDQQYRCGLRESACGAYCGGGYDTKWNFCNNNSKGVAVGNCQCLTKGSGGGTPSGPDEGKGGGTGTCGDNVCDAGESCAADCGGGGAYCGDNSCNNGETGSSCPGDCPSEGFAEDCSVDDMSCSKAGYACDPYAGICRCSNMAICGPQVGLTCGAVGENPDDPGKTGRCCSKTKLVGAACQACGGLDEVPPNGGGGCCDGYELSGGVCQLASDVQLAGLCSGYSHCSVSSGNNTYRLRCEKSDGTAGTLWCPKVCAPIGQDPDIANFSDCCGGSKVVGGACKACGATGSSPVDGLCCSANASGTSGTCTIKSSSDIKGYSACHGSPASAKLNCEATNSGYTCSCNSTVTTTYIGNDGKQKSCTGTQTIHNCTVTPSATSLNNENAGERNIAGVQSSILGTGDENIYQIEVDESGTYLVVSEDIAGGSKLVTVFVPQGGKGYIQFFHDSNANGIKDEGEDWATTEQEISLEQKESAQNYTLQIGWNLLGFTHFPTEGQGRTAKGLLQSLNANGGNATHIATYREGQFHIFSQRNGIDFGSDFNILPGEAYFIRSYKKQQFVIQGNKFASAVPVDVSNGWNLMSIVTPDASLSGEKVLDSMNSQNIQADALSSYESGLYTSLVKENGLLFGRDFPIVSTRGYFVRVVEGGGTRWTP